MKLQSTGAEKGCTGFFVRFTNEPDDKVFVTTDKTDAYRIHFTINIPPEKLSNRLVYFEYFLRKATKSGSNVPIRLEYENFAAFFSMAELILLENRCKNISFYIYNTPDQEMPDRELAKKIQEIINKVRREKRLYSSPCPADSKE